jgi:hypothetical protein
VLENRVLRRIFGHKREEVTGGWRRPRNEGLHNMYTSPNTIKVIKSRKMKWAGNVARIEGMINAFKILVGKPEGKRPLGRLSIDRRILERILGKSGGKMYTAFVWLKIRTSGGLL